MIEKKEIAVCIILSLVTCGIYGLYWLVCLTDDVNKVAETEGTSGTMTLLLYLVTCGIYGHYWMYKQGEKLDAVKQQRGINSSYSGVLYLILSIAGLGIVSYALIQDSINKLV